MTYEATLHYSKPLLRKSVFAFWRRSIGAGFLIALVVVALSLGTLVATGWDSWATGALGTVLVLGVTFAAALYFVHYRTSMRKLQEIGGAEAKLIAEDSSFTLSSDIGSTTLRWSVIKELWQFRGIWLLLYSPAQFTTLPIACLSPEMQAFVLQRVRAAGGKVS